MATIYGFEAPDYGLIDADPLTFKGQLQAFYDQLRQREVDQGDLDTVNANLTTALSERDAAASQLQELQVQHQQLQEAHDGVVTQHNIAVAAYRQALLNGDPSIPPELIQGETVDQVNANLEKAKGVVEYVRQKVTASPGGEGNPGQIAKSPVPPPRVPAGAPGRTLPDVSAMSAREKLVFGTSQMAAGR